MKFVKGFSADAKKAYESAGAVSTDAVGGIRTIASFTNEEKILALYSSEMNAPMKMAIRKAHVSGISYGFSQFCTYSINSLAFWYGARLVDQHEWKVSQSVVDAQCIHNRMFFKILFIYFPY